MKSVCAGAVASVLIFIQPAVGQDTDMPSEFTISRSAKLASDYCVRGVSRSDTDAAIQGGITISPDDCWGSRFAA